MSIITIRSMFEKRGCQVVLGAVAVLLGIGLVFPTLNCGGANMANPEASRVLFTAAGKEVKASDFSRIAEQRQARAQDPVGRLNELGMQIDQLIQDAALQSLAAKYKVNLTDDQIKKFAMQELDMQLLQFRFQLQMNQTLKPNATEKDFDEAFKKAVGQTPAEAKKKSEEEITANLKDATKRQAMAQAFTRQGVTEAIAATLSLTEEDVKKTFDTYFLNRMAFAQPNKSPEARKADAEKAAAELKAGKPFAEVHKALLGRAPDPATEMTRGMLEADPNSKPLLSLKPNEISPVIDSFGTPTVYQLVKMERKLPPDFEKNKGQLLISMKNNEASKKLQEELNTLTEGAAVSWKEPTLSLVHEAYLSLGRDRAKYDKAKYEALLTKIEAANAKSASEGLAMAQQAVFDEVFRLSTSDQQKEMREKRAAVITATLGYLESHALRMDLVNIYREMGDKDQTFLELETALRNATGAFEADNQAQVKSLENIAFSLERSGFLTKDQGDSLREVLVQWQKDKADHEKELAELKRLEAEAEKEIEAQKKKDAEELKRLEAEDKAKEAASTGKPGDAAKAGVAAKAGEPAKAGAAPAKP